MNSENKFQIAPSLLASDLASLSSEVRKLEAAAADVLHFDVMDGHFVPNLTFGAPVIQKARAHSKLPFDAHLMIENPDAYLEDFFRAGCNWLSVHIEACPHLQRTVCRIKELGMKAGVAINPGTTLSTLDAILADADFILIMSVNPGFGGQSFIPQSFDRVRELKKKIGNRPVSIQIDGGIKKENIRAAREAGVDCAVVGTGLFANPDYNEAVAQLRAAASTGIS